MVKAQNAMSHLATMEETQNQIQESDSMGN